jgi:hypothetical protein
MPSEPTWDLDGKNYTGEDFGDMWEVVDRSIIPEPTLPHSPKVVALVRDWKDALKIAAASDLHAELEQERKDVELLLSLFVGVMEYFDIGLNARESTAFNDIQRRHDPTKPSAALAKARGEMDSTPSESTAKDSRLKGDPDAQ